MVDVHPDVQSKNNTIVRIHVLPAGSRTLGDWGNVILGIALMVAFLAVLGALTIALVRFIL